MASTGWRSACKNPPGGQARKRRCRGPMSTSGQPRAWDDKFRRGRVQGAPRRMGASAKPGSIGLRAPCSKRTPEPRARRHQGPALPTAVNLGCRGVCRIGPERFRQSPRARLDGAIESRGARKPGQAIDCQPGRGRAAKVAKTKPSRMSWVGRARA